MDYEKAYKASLKTAAQWIKDGCTDKEKICLKCVFPELRESEDERIRMALCDIVRDMPYMETELRAHGLTVEKTLAYLEKQKEEEGYEAIPVESTLEYKLGFKAGKESEKQKEQKHPNGCFTCDEYKKGYEEGRRNGFTAGYNKAMKEQKPHYCHHEVDETGWSEEYRKAYYDGWNNCNMQHEQAKAEQKPVEGKEYSSPECGTTAGVWSEDFDKEVENVHKRYPEVSFAKLTRIAYHFSKWANRCKDKEWSEENETSIAVKNPEAYKIGFADGEAYAKEQIQEWSEEDTVMCNAALALLRSHPNLMASNGINKSSIIRWLQSFRTQRRGFIDDICSKAGISIPYLDGNQWCILKGDNIQAGVVGFGDTKEDALANFIKDVPIQQEWSKEDMSFYDSIMREVIKEGMHPTPEQAKWFKSLPERFNPQPKQEWSEEDEKMSISILNLLCSQIAYVVRDGITTGKLFPTYANERDWFKKRIKSLRPDSYKNCNSQWKPSEEQMEALRKAVNKLADTEVADSVRLSIMYDHLKELM